MSGSLTFFHVFNALSSLFWCADLAYLAPPNTNIIITACQSPSSLFSCMKDSWNHAQHSSRAADQAFDVTPVQSYATPV